MGAKYHNDSGRFGLFTDPNAVKFHAVVKRLFMAGAMLPTGHWRDNAAAYGFNEADVAKVIMHGHVAENTRPTRRAEVWAKGTEVGLALTFPGRNFAGETDVLLVTVAVIAKGTKLAVISVYPKEILDPAAYR